jgi:hypothetical protein
MKPITRVLMCLAHLAPALLVPAARGQTIEELLPPTPLTFSQGGLLHAVSGDGVVFSRVAAQGFNIPCRWRAGQAPEILSLPTFTTQPFLTDADWTGAAAIGSYQGGDLMNRPLIWTQAGSWSNAFPFPQAGAPGNLVAMSDDGRVFAGRWYNTSAGTTLAVRVNLDEGYTILPLPPAATLYASSASISGDGFVVGGSRQIAPSSHTACLWTMRTGETVLTDLPTLPGLPVSSVDFLNCDGSIAVGTSTVFEPSFTRSEIIRWVNGQPESLGRLAGESTTYAVDMSGDGTIILCSAGAGRLAVWTAATGIITLQSYLTSRGVDLTGHTIAGARISKNGRVLAVQTTTRQLLRITLPPLCNADFNNDRDVGTDQDIEAFFACLAGACPACRTSDFNGDGDFGTDADIELFFRALAGNC